MAGELLGFNDVNLLQTIAEAYLLLALFFIAVAIPIGLIYRQFVLKRTALVALISVIIGFYAVTFFFVQLLLFTGMDVETAMLPAIVLGLITTAVVTALFARVMNRRPREVQFDGLKFAEKRSDRRMRQGADKPTAASGQQPARTTTASPAPKHSPSAAPPSQRPVAKQRKGTPVRVQRSDDIGEVDWERETQRWAADEQSPTEE